MVKRIKAINATFHVILTFAELIIAIRVLIGAFGSDDTLKYLERTFGKMFNQAQASTIFVSNTDSSHSATMLFFVLMFMLFSYFFITTFPKMVERKEKQMEMEIE